MKVLVLNGSPKEVSDTMCLTNSFLKGLNKEKGFEVKVIRLIEKNIKPCLGCFACWKSADGKCIQKDDQNEIMEEYKNADIVIYSFPLYSYAMPSHLKAFVDRLIPFNKMTMKEVNGHVVHAPRVDLSHQNLLFIAGCGFPNFEGNFDGLEIMIKNKFGPKAMTLFVSECPMLNEEEARPLTEPLIKKFELAGEYFAKHLDITPEMKKELETPMLDKNEYIKIVNSL
ncbi:MAG: flavodoxin family protein [Bacilli bacterium]|nr:flavodoxin family protein [Bacilli bacterium]